MPDLCQAHRWVIGFVRMDLSDQAVGADKARTVQTALPMSLAFALEGLFPPSLHRRISLANRSALWMQRGLSAGADCSACSMLVFRGGRIAVDPHIPATWCAVHFIAGASRSWLVGSVCWPSGFYTAISMRRERSRGAVGQFTRRGQKQNSVSKHRNINELRRKLICSKGWSTSCVPSLRSPSWGKLRDSQACARQDESAHRSVSLDEAVVLRCLQAALERSHERHIEGHKLDPRSCSPHKTFNNKNRLQRISTQAQARRLGNHRGAVAGVCRVWDDDR